MPKLTTRDLLGQLSDLEVTLNGFSYEELNAEEAKELKKSFNRFKSQLSDSIFGSDRPETNETMLEENAQINAANGNKLIAHASHEIRTPLNGIIGFTNLLKEEELTPSQFKKVDAIQTASHSLMEIINEVLEYSKLTAGIEGFDAIDFNFHALIKDVMFLCQTLIVDKSVSLKVVIAPNVPKVLLGDPSKLSQVLLNLLGNAIKFVEKGHIKLGVELKKIKKETFVLQFSIEDTGIGMSKEQLDIVFESYQQADKSTFDKYGGTGLGLSIVKEIITKQGGSIKAKSSLGIGTTFEFVIPFQKGNVNNIPKNKPKTIGVSQGKNLLGSTKILVFEDNELNQHLISEQLRKWDCEIYVTANAADGLSILNKRNIDIILMDLKMPGMSGFEVSKSIRSLVNKKISQTPIIAFSADFTAQDQELCYASGINDFLLKPYTLNELMIKLLKRKKERNLTQATLELLKQETISVNESGHVDLSLVLNECYGEIDMLAELIRLFKQNVYEFIGSVKIGISNENFEEIFMAAHKIKAGLALMNTNDLKSIIVGIEENCKMKKMGIINDFFKQFLQLYPKKEALIDIEFEKLKQG
jgi:signal transduction histidine kinase/FixJ family two-component response regulator